MHGDYSRGHEPDRKRGHSYRRVLLQMGRPVLDSDVAASVDALLGEVRAATRGLSCAAGSPDLGFLVTPGRLLGIFAEAAAGLTVAAGTPDVWIDYRVRYAGRFPALRIAAVGDVNAAVTLPMLAAADPAVSNRAALWARVETATTINVNGIAVPLSPASPDAPRRVEFATGAATLSPLHITLQAGAEVWLFLLEQDEAAGGDPAFWIAPGSYHVDGLVVDARGGGPFPSSPYPEAAGFPWAESPRPDPPLDGLLAPPGLPLGGRLVAYLEVFERHVTHVEDPGIHEEALGAGDTCARTELLGQVKLASITGVAPSAAALRAAFDSVAASGGELTIHVPAATPVTDPCALPDPAGYRGADNRLYRVEVHGGGGLSQVRLKWSRDNGCELFAATVDAAGRLVFEAGTALASGDIVEVLSNVVDLGDDALAQVSAGGFVPARRAVGQLGQLVAGDSSGLTDDVAFTLVDIDDGVTPVVLDDRYGTPSAILKLRRWHGTLDPQGAAGPHPLEDAITVTLSETGTFRPGQYWQYEARVRRENANGPWRSAPHGPERRFAPLALLEYRGAAEPLELLAWLDERFSHPCDLDADDVAFYGERVGTANDTVQEALEELYERLPAIEQWPVVAAEGINWFNDRTLPLARFNEGLRVTFSEEMHPASASTDTFVVSLEVPADDDGEQPTRRSLIVDGRVDVDGPTWTFVPTGVDSASVGRWVRHLGGPVRCRVRLAAGTILDRAGERPLDGDVFGIIRSEGYDAFIDLRLPSGDGDRGGDFESWFYLTGPPPLVAIEHVNPADGVRFKPGTGPLTILMSFTDHVRFASITATSLTVAVRHSTAPAGDGVLIPGTIQPYPFETEPGVVSRVTFAPDDPDALRPAQAPATGEWVFTIRARGMGAGPIVDLDDRPIDGAGTGAASDFVSRFFVTTVVPQ